MKDVEIATKQVKDLIPAPYNPRTISEGALAGLSASVERFGMVEPVVWNKRTGRVVGGHQRLKVLQQMGETETQVVVVDLDDTEEKALNIALNNPAIAGDFTAGLHDLLTELQDSTPEIDSLLRFDELADLTADLLRDINQDNEADPDDVPEPPEDPVSKPGDLWLLGKHRLLVGDATSAEDVARLFDGEEPRLMVTDPPYGVEYDPTWRHDSSPRTGKVSNDDRADWREAWALFPGDVAYVWHSALHAVTVAASLAEVGFDIRTQIIWAKNKLVIGRGDYHWQHEPCWYAVRKGRKGHWTGSRKETTVWAIEGKDEAITIHGTQKPVECMRRPIINNSKPGQVVYDPFLGSGTTIIAAETANRTCYGLEIDPVYADVIVKRWENYTGKTAERTGATND